MTTIGPFDEPIPKAVMQRVAEVIRKIEITDVRLIKSSTAIVGHPDPATAEFAAEHKVQVPELDGESLDVRVGLVLRLRAPGENQPDLVTVSAVFRLAYVSAEMNTLPKDALAHFANTNAVHNVWPYWREFVQNMFGRMGLPSLTLPLLKLQQPPVIQTNTDPIETKQATGNP